MFEEPYRWVEAVGNRRQYLDEQFKQGSPVVALSYADGILLLTVSRGTPKLYEIYDRIALGGMGHPADLEKLRFSLLEMAHVEGFNRSPSDVTGARLMKHGLAPTIKQAFEEIFKAPFIVKILLAELGLRPGRDAFLAINYDGTFEETTGCAVLAATPAIQTEMGAYLKQEGDLASASLEQAVSSAVCAWAVGSLAQILERTEDRQGEEKPSRSNHAQPAPSAPDKARLLAHLRETVAEKTLECAVLERGAPGSSKYRALKPDEVGRLLPRELRNVTRNT
ncbi:MAG: proteasome subunit alpha [Nitrospirota bacterium]